MQRRIGGQTLTVDETVFFSRAFIAFFFVLEYSDTSPYTLACDFVKTILKLSIPGRADTVEPVPLQDIVEGDVSISFVFFFVGQAARCFIFVHKKKT